MSKLNTRLLGMGLERYYPEKFNGMGVGPGIIVPTLLILHLLYIFSLIKISYIYY